MPQGKWRSADKKIKENFHLNEKKYKNLFWNKRLKF